jgi:lipopolysaccharide/colanic/teichoic acid biosynthesis glycosyltransferase
MRLKRKFDVVVSSLMLILSSPVLMATALAIWLDSGLPVLFRQERVGVGFKRFYILKFRTMRVANNGPLLTVSGDERITKIGRFLRLTKIDEFPQFWNVLRGEMSLVGPRPEVPEYVSFFESRYKRILTFRPGITDFASICFRNEEEILSRSSDPMREYRERVLPIKLDLADRYIDAQNLICDVSIILRTALVMLWPKGFSKRN